MAVGNINIHFDQGGGTSSFTYSFGSCKAKNNKLEFKHTDTWLSVSKDDTLINLTAGANTDPDRDTDVEINLNNNLCGHFIVTQGGLNCSCDDATFHVDSAANPFPSGGDSNATLGSYRIDAKCMNTPTIDQSTVPNWIKNVDFNGTSITGVVEPNSSVESRPQATIWLKGILKPSGTCDRSITVNQDGTGCKCEDAFKITTKSPLEFDSNGGSLSFSYSSDENCITRVTNPTITYTPSSVSDWITNLALAANKTVTGTVTPNGGTERSATIIIKGIMKDSSECTAKITVKQAASNKCTCKDIEISFIKLSNEGYKTETTIGNWI